MGNRCRSMKHGYAKGVFIKVIILLKKHIRLQSFVGAASHHRHRTALVGGFLADSACMIGGGSSAAEIARICCSVHEKRNGKRQGRAPGACLCCTNDFYPLGVFFLFFLEHTIMLAAGCSLRRDVRQFGVSGFYSSK